MSNANSAIKVLRTALKRVQKGWTQNVWMRREDGKTYVCLEGAVYGYCDGNKHKRTKEQIEAIDVLLNIIDERYGLPAIPKFNDTPGRTEEEIEEVLKLGIIRLETDAAMDDEDFEDLLEFKERTS